MLEKCLIVSLVAGIHCEVGHYLTTFQALLSPFVYGQEHLVAIAKLIAVAKLFVVYKLATVASLATSTFAS